MECSVRGFREGAWWGEAVGMQRGHWRQVASFHILTSHGWHLLLLLVYLAVLIGVPYKLLRVNVHSRLTLRTKFQNQKEWKVPLEQYWLQASELSPTGSYLPRIHHRVSGQMARQCTRRPAGGAPESGGEPDRQAAFGTEQRLWTQEKCICWKKGSFRNLHSYLHYIFNAVQKWGKIRLSELWANVCVHFIIKNCVW